MNEKEVIDKFVNSAEFYIIEEYVSKPYEDTIIEQDEEIQRLKNNWDELKECIKNRLHTITMHPYMIHSYEFVLDKMKEIEENSYEK